MKTVCHGCGEDCSHAYATHLGYPYHFGCIPAKPKTAAKERFCCCCGESLGVIEAKHYDSRDTCGKQACEREMRDAEAAEREEAHRRLDEDMGWGRW